jgi:hypothetical protein
MTAPPIPTVLRIDVEPDRHQPAVGAEPWHGVEAMVALVEGLRRRLEDLSGQAFHPTWMVRLDPDIERCFVRADFAVRRHAELFDRIVAAGDLLGIHVHPYRWDPERGAAWSDHEGSWHVHCLEVACDVYRDAFGEAPRRASQGGYHLTDAVVEAETARGIAVDITAEPGLAAKTRDPSFGAWAAGPSTDFRAFPRRPYYPSRHSLSVASASNEESRPILMVPLTAYAYPHALAPWPRRIARTLLGRPRPHLPLNPWKQWPRPDVFWDLAGRAADEQEARYCALAIRTDDPASASHRQARTLLEALPRHPIARRLRVVDPLAPEIGRLATPAR